jgi:hypothetical protein
MRPIMQFKIAVRLVEIVLILFRLRRSSNYWGDFLLKVTDLIDTIVLFIFDADLRGDKIFLRDGIAWDCF